MRLQEFFSELHRRRVIRSGALYIVGAWLLLQVADLAFPAYGIPDSALRYVFAATFMGFPLVIIFAWMFSFTSRGIIRASSIDDIGPANADTALQITDYAIFTLFASILVAIAYGTMTQVMELPTGNETRQIADTSGDPVRERKMIAVLPFVNLGPPDDEYFAAGITDEIASRLSSISALGVIANASVQKYAGKSVSPTKIAADLGVDYVLSGAVRWAHGTTTAGRVRISPRLVRAADGVQSWSDIYERNLADVFSIQAEIAKTVVAAVGARLLDVERDPIEDIPTENLDAYRAYLKSFGPREIDCAWSREQADHLALAVQLDPGFGKAWSRLAEARSSLYAHCVGKTNESLLELEYTLSEARRLAPNSASTLYVNAQFLMQIERDYAGSLSLLESAGMVVEQTADLVNLRGRIERRMGRWDQAIVDFRKSFVLDPQTWAHPMQIASGYLYQRKYSDAIEYFDRAIALNPGAPVNYFRKCRTYWLWNGNTIESRRVLEMLPSEVVADDQIYWARFWQEVYEGHYAEALQRLDDAAQDWFVAAEERWPKALLIAEAERLRGDAGKAAAAYATARQQLESALDKTPDEAKLHRALGLAFAGLGMKDQALAEGRKAMAVYPLSEHPYFGSTDALNQARIHTMFGDNDAAIEMLDVLLSMSALVSIPLLELDPRWAPLVNDPGFEALRNKHVN